MAALRELGREKSFAYRQGFLSQTREAIVVAAAPPRVPFALTDNYIRVNLSTASTESGGLASVRVTQVTRDETKGRIAGRGDPKSTLACRPGVKPGSHAGKP